MESNPSNWSGGYPFASEAERSEVQTLGRSNGTQCYQRLVTAAAFLRKIELSLTRSNDSV